jgi:hypothetical protein
MEVQVINLKIVTPAELESGLAALDAKYAEAVAQLVTQAAMTAAMSGLAEKSFVAEAVASLATRTELEAAKAAAIREATNGRPNWTETSRRVNEMLAPLLARIAALEAKLPA